MLLLYLLFSTFFFIFHINEKTDSRFHIKKIEFKTLSIYFYKNVYRYIKVLYNYGLIYLRFKL